MRNHIRFVPAFLAALLLVAVSVHGQELLYEQREHQLSYDGNVDIPTICFNGTDFAAFYQWAGIEDKNSGLHMRRVSRDGIAYGPQRFVLPLVLDDAESYISSVWDGSAYLVFFTQLGGTNWHIIRVNKMGKLLGHREVFVSSNEDIYWHHFSFVVGDRAYLFFATEGQFATGLPYLITVDRELKEKPTLAELPKGGLKTAATLGVALDPDKFLVFLGEYKQILFESELTAAVLLHVDFEGNVIQTIKPASLNPGKGNPAEQVETFDISEATGPVYTGDGYILVGTKFNVFIASPSQSYPYYNSSVKIDDTGQIIDGPFDLGNGVFGLYLGKPVWLGGYIGLPITDLVEDDTQMMLIGRKGRHIKDVSVYEHRVFFFEPEIIDVAYSGSGSAVAYFGLTDRNAFFDARWTAYSNIITEPKFVKPAIVYFNASEGSPFGDDRRLVMWSVSGCTNVTLTGPDFEMTNLPPVFHTLVDTNGERTRLTLSITGTDDSTKTRRLVIRP